MNAPHPLQQRLTTPSQPAMPAVPAVENEQISLLERWDIIVDNRWLIAAILAAALVMGGGYAFLSRPVYESNLLIQVEDSAPSAKNFLGDASTFFDVKTQASAEIEILRSRMVVGQAVDNTLWYVTARPRRLPLVGDWLARHARGLSDPGLFGIGGWVSGTEAIKVSAFDVPEQMEGAPFRVTARGGGRYDITHSEWNGAVAGTVGTALTVDTARGPVKLTITQLDGRPGAEFELVRQSRLRAIEALQQRLNLAEKGRQSGVIEARLQDTDRDKLTAVLNEIGREYVHQNVERKAAEAQKTLAFLDVQLPQFKKQLDEAEEAYNKYRNQKGTVAFDEEAKLILTRSVELQSKLMEAEQKRRELASRFTSEHPSVKTIDQQIAAWNQEIASLSARVKGLPAVQQDALRLERDVKVNGELYRQLRNNALQLQLLREGKIGNARLIDTAISPIDPVKPNKPVTLLLAAVGGLLLGVVVAFARAAFFRSVRSAQEIEAQTGLNVYSTIPLSGLQEELARRVASKVRELHVLAQSSPNDAAVEALRSLRTALQFAMLESTDNRVLITGATPGVGKSFVSCNLSAVCAAAGKRVLLIDADLRKGHLNQYFGMERGTGLSELIVGACSEVEAIRQQVLPNLDFLSTGTLPPNPAELVVSGAFGRLLDQLSTKYDLVVIDSAPILVAADTMSIAAHVGTMLLVARSEQTHVGDLHESIRRLAHSGKTPTGLLLNAVDLARRHYGKYSYQYNDKDYKYHSVART